MSRRSGSVRSDQHFAMLRKWLEMEGQAERQRIADRRRTRSSEAAERTGETLLDLVIRSHTTGLGGRYLITLAKRRSPDRLPWHRLKAGSPVLMSDHEDLSGDTVAGVVSARYPDAIEVAVDDWPTGDRFRVDLAADEITRKRQRAAIDAAERSSGRFRQLTDILTGDREPDLVFGETMPLRCQRISRLSERGHLSCVVRQ